MVRRASLPAMVPRLTAWMSMAAAALTRNHERVLVTRIPVPKKRQNSFTRKSGTGESYSVLEPCSNGQHATQSQPSCSVQRRTWDPNTQLVNSEHVHEPQGQVIGHRVPAAFRAILTLAEFGLPERRDILGA